MDDHIQMSTAAEKGIVVLLYIHNCCCVYAKQTASFAWKIVPNSSVSTIAQQ